MTQEGQKFAQKQARRAGEAGQTPAQPDKVASGDFVPRTLLDKTRAWAQQMLDKRGKELRAAREENDALAQRLLEILRMTEPVTVQHYQGGHRAQVAAVHGKARDALEKAGRLTAKKGG